MSGRMRVVGGEEATQTASERGEAKAQKEDAGVSLFKVVLFCGITAGIGYYLGKRAGVSEGEAAAAAALAEERRMMLEEDALDLEEAA